MVDPLSGDGPNLGSNDGAFCYGLHSQPYRDFRPTLQLASILFQGHPALSDGPCDEPLHWLGLVGDGMPAQAEQPTSAAPITLFADGGYAVLRPATSSWALFRLPTYRFRPAHVDPLHLDLWHQGVNLLRDGGSYAYNASFEDLAVFPGIASHNTVQFDGAEPMPRLGRFLWGDWLQLEAPPQLETSSITAAYRCPPWPPSATGASRCLRPPLDDHRHLFRFPEPSTPALASVPRGVAIGRNFCDWSAHHTADPLRSTHHPPGAGGRLGINALRHQNATAGCRGDRCSGSGHPYHVYSALALIFPTREGSLLPPVLLHPCWF